MKKIVRVLITMIFIFALTACSKNEQDGMYIKPSEFSEETLEVLELFDDEVHFFDILVDETVKYHKISLWVYRDGQWNEDGKTFGEKEFLSEKIAIRLTENNYDLYAVDENGHVRYNYPNIETKFEDSTAIGSSKVDRKIPIELNKEIPIWVKIGTNKNSIEAMDITEDFRNLDCNAGIAITITVSDEVIE